MENKNKYVDYNDLIIRNKAVDNLKRMGFIIIPKRTFRTLGWVFLCIGVLSIPIPLITIPLIALGLLLLGLSKQQLYEKIRKKIKLMIYLK